MEGERKSKCPDRILTSDINDEPQLQYYEYTKKVMPGRVLHNHNIVTSEGDEFVLNIGGSWRSQETWAMNITASYDMPVDSTWSAQDIKSFQEDLARFTSDAIEYIETNIGEE